MLESTNSERPGYTPSERMVGQSLDIFLRNSDKRIIITTFSSNVHRVQQIIDMSHAYGRKVAITGLGLNVVKRGCRARLYAGAGWDDYRHQRDQTLPARAYYQCRPVLGRYVRAVPNSDIQPRQVELGPKTLWL